MVKSAKQSARKTTPSPKNKQRTAEKKAASPGKHVESVRVNSVAPEMAVANRLHIGDVFGQGGMSYIEAAYDSNLQREIARKVLKPEFASNESVCGRLIEEAQITAQLDHPNIIPVYELGEDKKRNLYFTMKLVRGKTFNQIIMASGEGQRSEKELFYQIQIFLKVCDAVSFAHSRGVIHQDLKPDNIMVGEFGEVYLMDWGFALPRSREEGDTEFASKAAMAAARKKLNKRKRYTVDRENGTVGTTIFYMAPEQTKGDIALVDERTDIYFLGGILYKILTQKPPHFGDNIQEVAKSALKGQVIPPPEVVDFDLPARLNRICLKALAKNPEERYQTVAELKEDLEGFLQCGWQFDREHYETGSLIVKEGEPGDTAYIITKGRCRVYKTAKGKQIDLGELRSGDVFGELAVFAGQPRGASVEAIEPVTVMLITRDNFEEDLGMSFWLGLFVKALAERFLEASRQLTDYEVELKRLKSTS